MPKERNRKRSSASLPAAAALLAVSGWAGPASAAPSSAGLRVPMKHITIGVSFDQVAPIRTPELAGIEAQARARGVKVIYENADDDPETQASQIQTLIETDHVNAVIAIADNATEINGSIKLANESNVPFIAEDRAPVLKPGLKLAFQITANPVLDGLHAGEALVAAAPKPIYALDLIGALTDTNAIGRRDGFVKALTGAKNAHIVASVPTDWLPSNALSGTENALQAHPNINAIFVPSDILLNAVLSALKQEKRVPGTAPGDVTISSIDGGGNGCAAVKDGQDAADNATPIGQFGKYSVNAAIEAIEGQKISQKIMVLPGVELTRANFATVSKLTWGCAVSPSVT